ncbi:hypothetical protein Droror1_Dr00017826 [Drosera rotundifolia]
MAEKDGGKDASIEIISNSIDGSLILHVVYDVVAFLLYMHEQIPAVLQDMTLEFDLLQAEHKNLELDVARGDLCTSSRRKQLGKRREVKMRIKRVEKLMKAISNLQTAFQLIISEVPVENVLLILGGSPRRPQYVYEMLFPEHRMVPQAPEDTTNSRTAESLSKKVIRALISKGAGSSSYSGPSKLFLLVKAPDSFSMPLHFLPNHGFRWDNKVVPLRLKFKCHSHCQEKDISTFRYSETGISNMVDTTSDNRIWFQCRHIVKGMSFKEPSPEE